MLSNVIAKKIEDFVYGKPRSVDEVAKHIGKNWRTADRYIEQIQKDFGTISTRVFREGTRGSLKIVFWSSVEKASSSVFQEQIEKDILNAKKKEHFSSFDIFQHIPDKNKQAHTEITETQREENIAEYAKLLKSAEKQVLIFSGNLSIINEKSKKFDMFDAIDYLVSKKIPVKVLCRIDLVGKQNVEKVLSLNFKYGKELIEVRHHEQPLRGAIVDNKKVRLKEINSPTSKKNELKKEIGIIYSINDKDWADWLSKIFWKMFNSSVDANLRLIEMNKIKT